MARAGFFRVKQAAHFLFYKNSAVTNGTKVDWDDIHKFLHFIDRLEVLVGRFNGGVGHGDGGAQGCGHGDCGARGLGRGDGGGQGFTYCLGA